MVSKELCKFIGARARRRRREFTITWRTVHFNYNLYRTSSFPRPFNARLCYNEHLRAEGHASKTAHRGREITRDRNCHYAVLHAREFDFYKRDRTHPGRRLPACLPSSRVTLARERV